MPDDVPDEFADGQEQGVHHVGGGPPGIEGGAHPGPDLRNARGNGVGDPVDEAADRGNRRGVGDGEHDVLPEGEGAAATSVARVTDPESGSLLGLWSAETRR